MLLVPSMLITTVVAGFLALSTNQQQPQPRPSFVPFKNASFYPKRYHEKEKKAQLEVDGLTLIYHPYRDPYLLSAYYFLDYVTTKEPFPASPSAATVPMYYYEATVRVENPLVQRVDCEIGFTSHPQRGIWQRGAIVQFRYDEYKYGKNIVEVGRDLTIQDHFVGSNGADEDVEPLFAAGQVVGVGLIMVPTANTNSEEEGTSGGAKKAALAFVTVNGQLKGKHIQLDLDDKCKEIWPHIQMRSKGILDMNFGTKPFKYPIEEHEYPAGSDIRKV